MALQHLRSSTANKRPVPGNMSDGQLGINTNLASPGLFFKDTNGDLVKVGPVHVGTTAPNASPAAGGTAGNSVGEQWLDTTGGTYVFKVWDGSAWRSESGTFVDVNGDVMTGALGIIAGTASAPGLYFTGDTNTGIYSPGADQVAISTGGSGRLFVDASGNVGVGASPTEKARIDSSGRLLVGTSNAVSGNTHVLTDTSTDTTLLLVKDNTDATRFVSTLWHKATTGDNVFFSFYTEGTATLRGNIDYNRSAGQIRYNVTSDRRLKSDIQPATTALTNLSAIKVRSYKWTETGYQVDYGFIAQELSQVVPDAVKVGDNGDKVIDTWAVDNAKLVPMLTKALQEAVIKIEALEVRLTALETK